MQEELIQHIINTVDLAEQKLLNGPAPSKFEQKSQLLFMGNHHETIPSSIFLDDRFNSNDVRAWLLIKSDTQIGNSVTSNILTKLQNLLCVGDTGSKHTAIDSIKMLRAARLLTLCKQVRDKQGRYRGNVFALHDADIGLKMTLGLDPTYMDLLEEMKLHRVARLRQLSIFMLQNTYQTYESGEEAFTDESSIVNCAVGLNKQLSHLSQTNEDILSEDYSPMHKVHLDSPIENQVHEVHSANQQEAKPGARSVLGDSSLKHQVRGVHLDENDEKHPSARGAHGQINEKHRVHGVHISSSSVLNTSSSSSLKNTTTNTDKKKTEEISGHPVTSAAIKINRKNIVEGNGHRVTTKTTKKKITESSDSLGITTKSDKKEITDNTAQRVSSIEDILIFHPTVSEVDQIQVKHLLTSRFKFESIAHQRLIDELSGRIESNRARGNPVRSVPDFFYGLCRNYESGNHVLALSENYRKKRENQPDSAGKRPETIAGQRRKLEGSLNHLRMLNKSVPSESLAQQILDAEKQLQQLQGEKEA